LLWNASASVPIGLYGVEPIHQFAVTNLVVAIPSNSLATFLAERGYVPLGVLVIKRTLPFLASQYAETSSSSVSNRDGHGAPARSARRPLPVWQGCRATAHKAKCSS
jgi:type IV secretory pathway protease TraF